MKILSLEGRVDRIDGDTTYITLFDNKHDPDRGSIWTAINTEKLVAAGVGDPGRFSLELTEEGGKLELVIKKLPFPRLSPKEDEEINKRIREAFPPGEDVV